MSVNEWQAVGADLLALCNAEQSVMLRLSLNNESPPWMLPLGFPREALEEYFTMWAPFDLLYHGAVRHDRIRAGMVSTEDQLIDRREYLASDYFNDFLKRYDIERQSNVCLTVPQPELHLGPSALTIYRGLGSPAFSDTEMGLLRRLGPHLSMAARATWHIEALNVRNALQRGALNEVSIALFGLDSNGRVIWLNEAAEALARANRWVCINKRRLSAGSELREVEALQRVLDLLATGRGSQAVLTAALDGEQAIITTTPLTIHANLSLASRVAAGVVWIVPCSSKTTPDGLLAKLFGLTAAEQRLLKRLVLGESVREAAELLSISVHTARNQLKSLLRKTGRRSQGQLLALAARIMTVVASH